MDSTCSSSCSVLILDRQGRFTPVRSMLFFPLSVIIICYDSSMYGYLHANIPTLIPAPDLRGSEQTAVQLDCACAGCARTAVIPGRPAVNILWRKNAAASGGAVMTA